MDQNFRRLIDLIPDAVCVHEGGRIVYVNPAFERWIGIDSPADAVGAPIVKYVHPDSVPAMLDRIMKLRDLGDRSEPTDALLVSATGSTVEVEWVAVLTEWDARPAYQVMFREVGTERRMHAALAYQATLVEHITDAFIVTDTEANITQWNPAAERIYQRPAAAVHGTPVSAAVGAALDPVSIALTGPVVQEHQDARGNTLAVRVTAAPTESGYVLVCSDRSELRQAERHFLGLIETMSDGMMVVDEELLVRAANPAARSILRMPLTTGHKLTADTLSAQFTFADGTPISFVHPAVASLFHSGTPVDNLLLRATSDDQSVRWVSVDLKPLDPCETSQSMIAIRLTDVTAQVTAHATLEFHATHDPLTGLHNRDGVLAHIDDILESGACAAVLFIDLDHFAKINASRGHTTGDNVLCTAAERLREIIRAGDMAGRVGSDEFVIVLHGHDCIAAPENVAAEIRGSLSEPLQIAGDPIRIDASVGITQVAADDQRTAQTVLRDADVAMFEAKRASRDQQQYTERERTLTPERSIR